MRFDVEHRFCGPPAAVAALLTDPSFYESLDLPDVSRPVLLDRRAGDSGSTLRLRYEFRGSLDRIGRRVLGRHRLTWVQQIHIDGSARKGRLDFEAEADPRRLHGSADLELAPDDGGTIRRLAGELVVDVPLIGSWAEAQILPGLLRRLDIEAVSLDGRLRG